MTTDEDPFGTAELRARVLQAWAASPARFREDANAEDDLVRGGYRDRVVVELAQNAADAAARAGVAGRLVLTLDHDVLRAANTGAPLDAAGVESLSTLRASTKRDDAVATVGRFGVGFAAVLAVSDEPRIVSTTGAVRWDATAARLAVAAIEPLRAEHERRGGQVPVLRLPYAWSQAAPAGATTVVELPLRDDAACDLARRLLDEVDDALLLALPGLSEIVVDVEGARRVVADGGRWQVVRREGRLDPQLLADRPVEERDRPTWSLTWALPLAGQPVPAVLHAPTPTDEPLGLPALLVASLPLDPTRRHVAPGPLADHLVTEAAAAYVDLLGEVDDEAQRLSLVPGEVPVGRLDGQLRTAVMAALTDAPVLRTVGGAPVAARDAVSVVGAGEALLRVLDGVVEGLVPDHAVLDRLGGRRMRLADAIDLLADLEREPRWWHGLYAALAEGPVDTEALGSLPVPLADGRLVRGPRGALLPVEDLSDGTVALGLRVVHPQAAHPLLARLGAAPATARAVLERPETREAVASAWEHHDPAELADAVLALVAVAAPRPAELPWLAGLVLVDDEGEPAAADELLLPGSRLADLVEPGTLATVHPDLVERWGAVALTAVGVLSDLTVAEVHDVVLDPATVDEDSPLPDLADWVAATAERLGRTDLPPTVRAMRGLRELDVVADETWPELLAQVAGRPDLRSVLLDPVTVDLGAEGQRQVPSYPAWWVRTRGRLAGRPPGDWATPGAPGLAGLYDPLPDLAGVDPQVLTAVGVRTSLAAVLGEPDGADDLLDRMADAARTIPRTTLVEVYREVARLDPESVSPPSSVRVGPDLVVPAEDAVVVDAPHHLQLPWSPPPLVVPLPWAGALADVLDVARSSERVAPAVDGGSRRDVPTPVARVVPGVPTRWWEHDDLTVDGHAVAWWVGADGEVHAATLDGLARGLAWTTGRWDARWLLAAALEDPSRVDHLLAEARLDGP